MKQTFIVGVETEKKDFNEWIEEHDKEMYNQALEDYTDMLKNEWTIDSILCATDKYKLIAIFKRIEEQLMEHLTIEKES